MRSLSVSPDLALRRMCGMSVLSWGAISMGACFAVTPNFRRSSLATLRYDLTKALEPGFPQDVIGFRSSVLPSLSWYAIRSLDMWPLSSDA